MCRFLSLLAVWVAMVGCASAPPQIGTSLRVRESVERASEQFVAARQRGDATEFASLFTETGSYMVPGLLDAVGRTAVSALAQEMFARGPSADFKVHRREVDVFGDSAYELAWFSETSRRHHMQGRHFILWRRGSDDVWRVHRYHYNFSDAKPID